MVDEKDMTVKLAKASFSILTPYGSSGSYPWTPDDVDKLDKTQMDKSWKLIVEKCRYFYKKDPFVSTVINKIVDLSINGLVIKENKARKSVKGIMDVIKPDLLVFLKSAALEYLISGLVIPEIEFNTIEKQGLEEMGIKRFEKLSLPTEMWLRDPALIKIKDPLIGSHCSYFVEIPEALRFFITNEGKYSDGSEDRELYLRLLEEMPDFIAQVIAGKTSVLLESPMVIKYRTLTGSGYPIPYLYPVIESLEHKRNIRRMDYSIASRVITAIQLITLGDKDFPLTEDNEDQLEKLKQQMLWRDGTIGKEMERIFQLFGNHTLKISWIFPETDALLDEGKYKNINNDIAVGLGFPRILITGETEKSFTSDADVATVSPLHTMRRLQEALLPIAKKVLDIIVDENNLGGEAQIKFKSISMMGVKEFVAGLVELYTTGNLSRDDYAAAFGYDIYEQLDKRVEEKAALKERDLDEMMEVPFSPKPTGKPIAKPAKPAPKPTTKGKASEEEE